MTKEIIELQQNILFDSISILECLLFKGELDIAFIKKIETALLKDTALVLAQSEGEGSIDEMYSNLIIFNAEEHFLNFNENKIGCAAFTSLMTSFCNFILYVELVGLDKTKFQATMAVAKAKINRAINSYKPENNGTNRKRIKTFKT